MYVYIVCLTVQINTKMGIYYHLVNPNSQKPTLICETVLYIASFIVVKLSTLLTDLLAIFYKF